MSVQNNAFVYPLLAAALVTLGIAVVSWRERAHPGASSTIAVAIHASLSDLVWISERLSPAVHESWSHAIAVMHKDEPHRVVGARAGSPLILRYVVLTRYMTKEF